jgi:aminoglycoside 6'-N-acetyltransferase
MPDSTVSLAPFQPGDAPLLRRWLAEPHVAAWYPEPNEHVAWAVSPPPGGARALILHGQEPVGYLRWQAVPREVLDSVGLNEIPAGAVDADILVGEPASVGKAIGPQALELLAQQLQTEGNAPLIGLTTSIDNTFAHRGFERAGFRIVRRYTPPGYGECYLMVRNLHPVYERSGDSDAS